MVSEERQREMDKAKKRVESEIQAAKLASELELFLGQREHMWPNDWTQVSEGDRFDRIELQTVEVDGTPRTFEVTVEEVS